MAEAALADLAGDEVDDMPTGEDGTVGRSQERTGGARS